MGGPSMVTKVRIGAFALELDLQKPDQRAAAAELGQWDREKGNRNGVFTAADTWGDQHKAAIIVANALNR